MNRNLWRTRRASREAIARELEELPFEDKVAIGVGRYLVVNQIFVRGTPEQRDACLKFFGQILPLLRRLDVLPEDWDDINKP